MNRFSRRPSFPIGTQVGVIDKERPNYGLTGHVRTPFKQARQIPDGWVWVEFDSGEGLYSCEYDPKSLVSIFALGVKAFKEMISEES